MAIVHIPAAMRSLTGGEVRVSIPGETLREVMDGLEARYPGLRDRLLDGEKLKAGLAVFVNGEIPSAGLRARLSPEAEIYFAPAIAGG